MHAICPECKKLQPVGEDDRMLDHTDPYGTFSCEGVGQESGIVVFGKKIKKSRDSDFDHEMGDEDEHSPDSTCGSVGLPAEKEYIPNEVKPLLPPKPSIFGSIGAKIMESSELSIFHPGARKLSQKERKARAK